MRASILAVSAFTILCAWGVFASPARVPIPDGPQANQRERPPIRAEAAPAAAAAGATPAPVAPPPSAVVSVNGSLSHTVEWQFGGKTQRGWYLYVPLIQRLIGSDADPHSPEFSDAVAR